MKYYYIYYTIRYTYLSVSYIYSYIFFIYIFSIIHTHTPYRHLYYIVKYVATRKKEVLAFVTTQTSRTLMQDEISQVKTMLTPPCGESACVKLREAKTRILVARGWWGGDIRRCWSKRTNS